MFRKALFNIIRQEQRDVEDRLEEEEHRPTPDARRLVALRREFLDLRRELEHFPEAG